MQTDLKRHKGFQSHRSLDLNLWPLLTYLNKECVGGGGRVLGPIGLTLRGLRDRVPARPTPGPGNIVICDLASALSLGFLSFSPDLSDCCILLWLLFLHLSLKKRCFLHSTLIFSTLHSLRTSEVHTPDVQTLGIKVKVRELGRTGSSHPSWVACWLWTLEISLHCCFSLGLFTCEMGY